MHSGFFKIIFLRKSDFYESNPDVQGCKEFMTVHVSQTNIQLFNQMLELGYSLKEVERVGEAYFLATEVFNCQYRGSGKPLLSHLIGVASLLVSSKSPTTTIISGLLHAYPGDGDFGWNNPDKVVKMRCGADVVKLVRQYLSLEYKYDTEQLLSMENTLEQLDELRKEAIVIRLANEVEDYLDNAINFYAAGMKKGFEWRMDYINLNFPILRALAIRLDLEAIKTCLDVTLVDLTPANASIIPLSSKLRKSGKMYFVEPISMKHRYGKYFRRVLRKLKIL